MSSYSSWQEKSDSENLVNTEVVKKRSCWSKSLETDAQYESVSSRTISSLETASFPLLAERVVLGNKNKRVEAQARHAPGNRSQV